MTIVGWAFDGLLGLALIVLGIRILFVNSLFHAVVLFICLGLMMALTWVRLGATDVALAEAGIGAALTGVLLVDLLHKLRRPDGRDTILGIEGPPRSPEKLAGNYWTARKTSGSLEFKLVSRKRAYSFEHAYRLKKTAK